MRTVGPYQLLTQLGNTSQGPVFAARIPGNEAQFALKVFQRQLPPEEVARVRQEIQAVSRLEHPGIVRPVDVGLEQGRLYVVYEHVPGPTLQEQLSKSGPLPSDQAARMVADLAEALHAAHEVGVLHRDLHPGCVVVDSRSGRARVGDFGHPHDLSAGGSQARPTYQAPEQLKGEPVDRYTDVYGLGAVLYELLTCMPPFSGLSHEELRQRILAGRPDAPRDLVASVDGAVERVCLRALALAPRKRYPTAEAFSAALRRAADRRAGRPSLAVLGLLLLCWALSLGVAGLYGWREHEDRLSVTQDLERAQGELETARADAAAVRSDLGRTGDELRAERDGRRRDADQHRREVATLKQQLQMAAQATAGGGTRPVIPARGDLARMVVSLLEDLQAVPGTQRLQLRLLRARRDLAGAQKLLEGLRAGAPQDEELLVLAINLAINQGQREQAESLREELERTAPPGSGGATYARLLSLEGKQTTPEELNEVVKELREKSSGAPYLLVPLASLLRNTIQQAPPQQGQQLLQEALRAADKALQVDPCDSEARHVRSQLYTLASQMASPQQRHDVLRRALGDLELLRDLTGQPGLWVEAGKLHFISNNHDQALVELEEGVAYADQLKSPQDQAQSRIWLGNVLAVRRDEQRATQLWRDALQALQRAGQGMTPQVMEGLVNGLVNMSPQGCNQFLQTISSPAREQLAQIVARFRQQQQQQQQQQRPR